MIFCEEALGKAESANEKGTYEDQIRIEELEVYAHHGVYPEENEKDSIFM